MIIEGGGNTCTASGPGRRPCRAKRQPFFVLAHLIEKTVIDAHVPGQFRQPLEAASVTIGQLDLALLGVLAHPDHQLGTGGVRGQTYLGELPGLAREFGAGP